MTTPARPLEVSVAVHEERLDQIESEQLRHRQRLHELEGDRVTLKLISTQMKELSASISTTAKQAALEAIDLAMESRDELGRRRWGLRAQWLAAGASFGGFIAAIAFQLTR